MSPLGTRIAAEIAASGPISVADYMMRCLHDPEYGYYSTREPFGRDGDFITAPEVSQMFGELVGVWLYAAWRAIGAPDAVLAEIGPGRGTLFRDILRTMARLDPDCLARLDLVLIETSERLRGVQAETLGTQAASVTWHGSVADLGDTPLILVGNEIFDALPFRQYVMTQAGWRERLVGTDETGALCFVTGLGSLAPGFLPPRLDAASPGAIVEVAPGRSALAGEVAARIATRGGAALFFDYGHLKTGTGDTFQAVRRHGYEDVFACPGEADLTSHVDFEALAMEARGEDIDVHLSTQGQFLLAMGLIERAGRLGASADEPTRQVLQAAVERLAAPDQMGDLFKVIALTPSGVAVPPFPFG